MDRKTWWAIDHGVAESDMIDRLTLSFWPFHWLSRTWFTLFLLDSVMPPATPPPRVRQSPPGNRKTDYGKGRKSHQSNYTPSGEVPIET